ncbi:MAG TPA: accessory gene regulator B family protein [Clostridiales bacterium]|nr:accessory gene regulator B family protein [Clostridiales bacterium]
MYVLENFSNVLASKIALYLNLDKEREEVLAYGAFGFIHTLWSTLLLVMFGVLFQSLPIILIIAFTVAALRKFSGGAHAASPNRCAAISVLVFGTLSLIIKYAAIYANILSVILYQTASFVFTYVILYKYCPVDTPNKPVKKQELRQKLRKASFISVFCYFCITVFLWAGFLKTNASFMRASIISICTGMLWQSITLTHVGHFIIEKLDTILQNINFMKGGRKK